MVRIMTLNNNFNCTFFKEKSETSNERYIHPTEKTQNPPRSQPHRSTSRLGGDPPIKNQVYNLPSGLTDNTGLEFRELARDEMEGPCDCSSDIFNCFEWLHFDIAVA